MTLTTNGKNWIARNLGVGNCMTDTSRSFTYHDDQNNRDISANGGTATMMNRLIDSLVSYITIGGTKHYASSLESANGSMPTYPTDVQWVMAHDAGNEQYCVASTPTPTPTGCTVGTKRCKNGTTVEQCFSGSPNYWRAVQTCGSGYECKNGACVKSSTPTPTPTPTPSPSTNCPWDLNGDGTVDSQDKAIFDAAYGSKRGDSNWNSACDFNGNGEVDFDDFSTLSAHFGPCEGGTPTPTPSPSPSPGGKPVTGPLEVYVGGGGGSCSPGSPNVTIDTSEAYAFFKDTPYEYIGVGGIMVHNLSNECRAYFAWEARIWDGYGYTTCPSTSPIHQEINRFLAEAGERPLSLKKLGASATEVVWGSFETLPTMEGEYTLCLSLWGNYDYNALIAELNAVGYYDKS